MNADETQICRETDYSFALTCAILFNSKTPNMPKYATEDIGGKPIRIPSAQEFAAFFKNYSPPDPQNPWLRNLLCAIYEGGPTGVTFNEAHRNIDRKGIKWGREATAMKLNQLARMMIRKMGISIGSKVKKPFCSPFLVEFDYDWKTNGHLHLRREVARSLEIVGWVKNRARQFFPQETTKQ
jgi:hypothetical protein